MKRLFFALILIAGTLAATSSDAQVFRGRVGFGFPHPRVFVGVPVPRPIVYAPAPAPYYAGGVVVAGPAYGYGYRHYYPVYHERRWFHGRRW